jgi:predicted dinucleotide-binding enzyme
MKITIIGRGNIGGGLGRMLEEAGHDVSTLGRDGGDASDADVVVLAVPGDAVADALTKVDGLRGKIVVDTTNAIGGRPGGVESLAHQVKAVTEGPVAKAFNTNFARLYEHVAAERVRPSSFYCGDDEAREVTERLTRDAGYDPVYVGGLDHARALEDFVAEIILPTVRAGRGQFFYRIAAPGEL